MHTKAKLVLALATLALICVMATAGGADDNKEVKAASVRDVAFDRYVDVSLIPAAAGECDSALLADLALQLLDGERVLCRPHKMVSGQHVLRLAIKACVEKHDSSSLDRLRKAVEERKDEKLAADIKDARTRIVERGRSLTSGPSCRARKSQRDSVRGHQWHLWGIEAAKIAGDAAALVNLGRECEVLDGIAPDQMEFMKKRIEEAKSVVGKGDPDLVTSLQVLGEISRDIFIPTKPQDVIPHRPEDIIPQGIDPSSPTPGFAGSSGRQWLIHYTLRNDAGRTVSVRMEPSGREYSFPAGYQGNFRSRASVYGTQHGRQYSWPTIHIKSTGATFRVTEDGDYAFRMSGGRIGFHRR